MQLPLRGLAKFRIAPLQVQRAVGRERICQPVQAERQAMPMAANPHVHYVDGQTRGYVSVTLTPGRMETRLQGISDRRDRNATVSTTKRFVVEDGRPGAVEA